MAQYYLRDNGVISNKKKEDKQKSYLEYNRQVSEKIKQQRPFKEAINKQVNYNNYDTASLQQERNRLQEQMLKYSGTTNNKGKYSLKSIFEAMSGQTKKKLEKDKTYQTAQERLNEMNKILEQRYTTSLKDKGAVDKMAGSIANQVETYATAGEETRTNPIESIKTAGVSFGEGAQNSIRAIKNSALDLANAISFNTLKDTPWYQRQKIEMQLREMDDPLKKTKTYQRKEEGTLSEGQQAVYNAGENLGQMAPSVALSTVTGSPALGSTAFYAQAQDNYYNEAKNRGYNEQQARAYSLTMAGVELLVERAGFDQLSGLGEGSTIKAMFGEAAEELVTPYIDSGLRQVAFKEKIDWNETNEEAISGAFLAMMTAGMTQLAGNGFGKVDALVNKINSGETLTTTDFSEALQEVQQADPTYVETMVSEAVDSLDKNTIEQIKTQMNLNENQTPTNTSEQVTETTQEQKPATQDANIQENAPTEKQDASTQEVEIKESTEKRKQGQLQFNFDETNNYKTLAQENNYSKQEINAAEKIQEDVLQISSSKEDVKQLSVLTSPPAKTQQTTVIKTSDGNETKHYNPSQKLATEGTSAIYDNIQNRVTSSERKTIETENKKTMESIQKTINKLRENGNDILADGLEADIEDYTYTVEKMGKNSSKSYRDMIRNLESGNTDIETLYREIKDEYNRLIETGDWNKIDSKTNNAEERLNWETITNSFLKILKNDKTGSYTPITKELEFIMDSTKHTAAQDLALASVEARKNPDNIGRFAENRLTNMYEKELKHHQNDITWQKENSPYDLDNNSPYRFTDEEYDFLDKLTAELKNIDQKTDNESFQMKLNEIDNFVGEAMTRRLTGIRGAAYTAKNALVNLIKQNNLLSIHVGLTNISGNVMDTIGLNKISKFGTNVAEKALSKTTGFKTNQYTKEGKSIYKKGLFEGLNNVGKEFITGVKISDMNTKYTIQGDIDYSKIGSLNYKTRAKTKLGKLFTSPINAEGRIVTGWLSLGDTPKSTAVKNESLFNQLHQEAIRTSIKTGKDSVFYRDINEKAGNVTFYYTDLDGDIQTKTLTLKEANSFLEDRNQIEATETMLDIAKEDGERAVYTGNNIFNTQSRKWVDALNSTVPGLGDLTLQFTTVANNMAVETYRHSPFTIPELVSKTKTLQKNTTYVENKIDEYLGKNKDFTTTKEYSNIMKENYKLQHDLGKAYGKVLAGTVADSLIILALASGVATGDVDKDEEEKGVQDYSIKIGDKYYSYDFGVFGMVAKSGVVAYNAFTGDKGILGNSMSLLKGYGESILEQTYIKSLTDTFMTKYGDSWEDKLADFGINLASSLTTPGFVKEITLAADNYTSRSTYSNDKWEYLANRLKANWNREDLPAKLDGWGNTMKKGSTMIDSAWNTFFKTDFMSTKKNDSVDKELADVYQTTGNHNVLPLKTNGSYKNNVNSFQYKNEKYVLSDKEKEKFSETYGKSAYSNMKKLFESNMYKTADYDTKVKYIKEIYDNARDVAKSEMLEGRGVKYYNTGQKVLILGENNRFEHLPLIEALDSGISYQSARKKIESPEVYKYATTIAKDYEIYSQAQIGYEQIKDMYDKTSDRQRAYSDYINTFSNLSSVEKAMLIKTQYSSLYKKYDEQIKQYLKSKKLSDEEYQYALKQMGIK